MLNISCAKNSNVEKREDGMKEKNLKIYIKKDKSKNGSEVLQKYYKDIKKFGVFNSEESTEEAKKYERLAMDILITKIAESRKITKEIPISSAKIIAKQMKEDVEDVQCAFLEMNATIVNAKAKGRKEKITSNIFLFDSMGSPIDTQKIDIEKLKIRNKIIEGSQRYVLNIARKFCGRGLELIDLIQEGNKGVIDAVYGYRSRKGENFSSYAGWWIRQAISKAIAELSLIIRIPVHMREMINKVNKTKYSCRNNEQDLTVSELARRLRMGIENVMLAEETAGINEILSLDSPLDPNEEYSLLDFIENKNAISPFEETLQREIIKKVQKALEDLNPREREIMQRRYGVNTYYPQTLEEIGDDPDFNLSRERIRQLEVKGGRKLKRKLREIW